MPEPPSEPRWLDDHEMRAWRTLLRAQGLLTDRLDGELVAEAGLPVADYEVLAFLSEAPGHRLRMSELAGAVLVTRSGLTRRVDRLAAEGLVARERCPEDRRGAFAVLTPAGERRLAEVAPVHLRGVREHFVDRLTRKQLTALADALGAVADALSEDDGATSCGGLDGSGAPSEARAAPS